MRLQKLFPIIFQETDILFSELAEMNLLLSPRK